MLKDVPWSSGPHAEATSNVAAKDHHGSAAERIEGRFGSAAHAEMDIRGGLTRGGFAMGSRISSQGQRRPKDRAGA